MSNTLPVAEHWTPPLTVRDIGGRCRLWLGSYVYGDGSTLQEAGDDLLVRLGKLAVGWRYGPGPVFTSETGPPDMRWLEFIYELGELSAAGVDIRERVFGSGEPDYV